MRRLRVDDKNDTFTVTGNWENAPVFSSGGDITYTISTESSNNITFGDTTIDLTGYKDDTININTNPPVDFEDCLPSFEKIQDMCAEYPGLEKAFDNFKIAYKMVHQDWVGKRKKK
jgi:hypothetical protein|tara:strand:+ start:749 stop:1096 length:348 start_codon:yes stop_codon:yes gene_type:complete